MSSAKAVSRPFLSAQKSSDPLTTRQAALDLRGGGGGGCWISALDGVGATKTITTGIGLAAGTATTISTRTVLKKFFGVENLDPISLLTARRIGVTILSFSIASYFLLIHNASPSTAVGIACLPTVVELSKTLFDGTPADLGFPAAGQAIVLLITSIFGVSFLNDNSHLSKDALLKIHSGWLLSNGVLMGCLPKLACKAWGDIDATGLEVLKYYVSMWGFGLLSLGTLSGCLANGMVTSKALAVGALPFLSKLILSKFV